MMDRGLMSHRGRGAGRRTDRGGGMRISYRKIPCITLPQWTNAENGLLTNKKKKESRALNKVVYMQNCMHASLLISWQAFSVVRNVGSLWPHCDSDTSHYQQAPRCDVWITNPASSIAP